MDGLISLFTFRNFFLAIGAFCIAKILQIHITLKRNSYIMKNVKTGQPLTVKPWYDNLFLGVLYRWLIKKRSLREIRMDTADIEPQIFGKWLAAFQVVLTEPRAIQTVLSHKSFEKEDTGTAVNKPFREFMGESLIMATGDKAMQQRKSLGPAFHYTELKKLVPSFVEQVSIMFNQWEATGEINKHIDVNEWMRKLTFDIIGKTGFGFDFHCLTEETKEKKDIDIILNNIFTPLNIVFDSFYSNLPLKSNQIAKKARADTDKLIIDIIEKRMKNSSSENDLLDMILRSDVDKTLTTTQILQNILLFFIAGHETTASSLASSIYFLAKNPSLQEEAYQEIKKVLGDELPTSETVKNLNFIQAITRETLRMNMPVPAFLPREAKEDTVILDHFIPKGTLVLCNVIAAHYSTKYWKEPKTFNPSRWFTEEKTNIIIPFAFGPRMCIGNKFSLLESHITLAMMIQRYTWTLKPGYEWKDRMGSLTTSPKEGVAVLYKKRN